MGCHVLLQGIFPTQGSNPRLRSPIHLLLWQEDSLPLGPLLAPKETRWGGVRDRRKRPDGRTAKAPDYNKHLFPARMLKAGFQPALQVTILANWLHVWWKHRANVEKHKFFFSKWGMVGNALEENTVVVFQVYSLCAAWTEFIQLPCLGAVSLTTNSTCNLRHGAVQMVPRSPQVISEHRFSCSRKCKHSWIDPLHIFPSNSTTDERRWDISK